MSTRCLIGKENKNKSIDYIYCHHDGYPTGVGSILIQNYQDEEKIDQLLTLGDMSCLGKQPVASESSDGYSEFCAPYSLGGEDYPKSTAKNEYDFLRVDRGQNYLYLFKNGKWYIAYPEDEFRELLRSLCGLSEDIE